MDSDSRFELLGYLDGSHPSPVATEPSYSLWARQDQLIRHALITLVSESITPYIAAVATAQQAWETLARLYANRSRTRVITLKEHLQNMCCDGRSVSEYLRALKSMADELGTIDRPLTDDDLTVYILNGLGPEFREIAASLRTRDSSLSFDDLHDRLVAHEESLRLIFFHPPQTIVTHLQLLHRIVEVETHISRGPTTEGANLNPQANFASSAATTADDWLLDSGATNHVTTDLANLALHSKYHGPDELQIGDGTGKSVEPPPLFPCVLIHSHRPSKFHNVQQSHEQPPTSIYPLSTPVPTSTPSPLPSLTSPSSPIKTNSVHQSPAPSDSHSSPLRSPPPQPLRTHPMVTRSQNNIFKPKTLFHATKSPLSLLVEPTCVTQALKDPNWRQAMSEEFSALVRQGMWELVPSHPSQHVLGCKWVFRLKRGKDGSIERSKARLVAKGFHQRPGSNYFNTFSLVIKPTTIRTVLSLAVSRGWSIKQLDVNNAFLHGHIDEVLYMQQPTGFVDHNFPSHVCRLRKSLYGLKQAPRAWFRALKDFFLAQGFFHSKSDNSLFIYHKGSTWIYFLVYVDDIIVTGNDSAAVQSIVQVMSATFSLKDLGPLSFYLGIEAISTKDGLFLSQQSPLASTSVLQLSTSTPLSDGTNYRKIVGSLQYLSLTRPDLSFAVSRLSQFMHRPTDSHWQAMKRVLRYLRGSVSHGLLLRPQPTLSLYAFSDADWAGDRDTYTSTTGYLVFLGSNPVSWRAAKQRAVARSSTEAEYRALATAASEVVWIQHLLSELGVSSSVPPAIFCDNIGATYLSSNPVFHSRMKHIAINLHFVRELVDRKVLHVSHISSHDQLADVLTKALPSLRFHSLRSKIGVADGTSVLRGHIEATESVAVK
ncbi:hypothetical protein SLEP1_g50892 [Rubroshorea leprosula]|uniref:Reverse transcriptase Ty1/copia-type domain-containing protein n=1 Tax=Rubroshorea leprosula TaxID=152421 RepID=A0AAV5M1G5_9ROSI|nr:hypothetical protein SLEP1_g50892 [Rubroshorea leprosula]